MTQYTKIPIFTPIINNNTLVTKYVYLSPWYTYTFIQRESYVIAIIWISSNHKFRAQTRSCSWSFKNKIFLNNGRRLELEKHCSFVFSTKKTLGFGRPRMIYGWKLVAGTCSQFPHAGPLHVPRRRRCRRGGSVNNPSRQIHGATTNQRNPCSEQNGWMSGRCSPEPDRNWKPVVRVHSQVVVDLRSWGSTGIWFS